MDDETIEEKPPKKEKPVFPGFTTSFKGHSQLPNEWLDEIISQIDSMAELKIVLYVYRHTWGFQEKKINPDDPAKHDKMKHITTEEFMHGRKKSDGVTRMDRGTGLSDWSVKDGIARALKHGYIICEIDARDKARVKKSYGLNFQAEDISSDERIPPTDSQGLDGREPLTDGREPPSGTRIPPTEKEGTSDRSEKETSERNFEKNTKERKNGTAQRKPNATEEEESSHSFNQSPNSSSLSSQGTKPTQETEPEVVLNERQQRIFDFAKKDIFKAKIPEITEKIKSECDELAELIETQEQFDSLVVVVRKRFPKGAIHLKNLTNASVLNEWSQTQEQCTPDAQELPVSGNDFAVTDEDLLEDIKNTVRFYGADDRFEECLENIMDFKRKAGLSNYKVCNMIANASIGVYREHGIDVFLEKLQGSLYW